MADKEKAMRFNAGKPQLSFIPMELMEDCARVFQYGAQKYDRDNWKKGDHATSLLDSLLRHVAAFQQGEYIDEESGLPHLGHIMCNVIFLTHVACNFPEFLDIEGLQEAVDDYKLSLL